MGSWAGLITFPDLSLPLKSTRWMSWLYLPLLSENTSTSFTSAIQKSGASHPSLENIFFIIFLNIFFNFLEHNIKREEEIPILMVSFALL